MLWFYDEAAISRFDYSKLGSNLVSKDIMAKNVEDYFCKKQQ